MGLINSLVYWYLVIALWLRKRRNKKKNRFDVYSLDPRIPDSQSNGLIASPSDWALATPKFDRNENILLIGSSTLNENKSSIRLGMKWRPDPMLGLCTLSTQFTMQLGNSNYHYDEIFTTSLDHQNKYIGQNISLEVLAPYNRYRILFKGYMRIIGSDELVYVKFRSIISNCGQPFDFKHQYDTKYMAKQFADKRPGCGYLKALDQLALQDRHEHCVQFRSVCTINDEEKKLFCWGFHARHFIDKDFNAKLRCKRILSYFSNGTYFHIGSIESTESQFDPRQRVDFGYACPRYQSTYPIQKLSKLVWDQVTSSSRQLEFNLTCHNIDMRIEPVDCGTPAESLFFDLTANGKRGRAMVLINDCMESSEDKRLVEKSVSQYLDQVHQKRALIDLGYLSMESSKRQLDTNRPMVVSLTDQDCQYSSLCGAKAASLAQLIHHMGSNDKFKVPNGVVLTRFAYDSILESNPDLRREERRLAGIVCRGKQHQIKEESERFQKIFSPTGGDIQLTIPQGLLHQLERTMLATFKMESINDPARLFAVRSSSWGEDEDNMSAAGQLTTLLSVQGFQQLRESILICFGSKYSQTNLEYKRQHGLPIDMPMAIVIQEMVECDKAGVMFTCDPTSGDERELLITANYGLGESVVSGAADPDSIKVSVKVDPNQPNNLARRQATDIREVLVGEKSLVMTSESVRRKQNKQYGLSDMADGPASELDNHLAREKCCLSDGEIMQLAQCGLNLAHYFQSPRDLEWGIKDGQLFLFQSRPITGLDSMNDFELLHEFSSGMAAEREWITRANIGEVLPFAIRPLTLTYYLRTWSLYGAAHISNIGLIDSGEWYQQRTEEVNCISYFYFFILRMSMTFCFGSGKDRPLMARAMEMGFFGHEVDEPELSAAASEVQKRPNPFGLMKFKFVSLPYRWFPNYMYESAKRRLRNLRRDILKHKFVKTSSMEDLQKQLDILVTKGLDNWIAHIMIILVAPEYNHTLTSILAKYINEPNRLFAVYSKMLSSCNDVLSAGVPLQIGRMSKTIPQGDLEKFLAMDARESLRYITSNTCGELTKQFNRFMEDFGHRSYNEFELVSKPWRDQPEFVVSMIKKACQERSLQHEQVAPTLRGSAMLRDELGINLNLWDRLYVDYYLLPKCHQFLRVRERTKDLLIYNADCVRDAVNMLAKELRENSRIPDEDLLCYMSYHEVQQLVKRHDPALVDQAHRRRRFIKKLDNWKFDEIQDGYEFLPRHLTVDSDEARIEKERLKCAPKITGTPASSGVARGPVCIVNNYDELDKVKPGDILVTYSTDIAFSPIFPVVAGIITEIGGMISHGAVIARESGLPSLIGVRNATTVLSDGEEIELDANSGYIVRLG